MSLRRFGAPAFAALLAVLALAAAAGSGQARPDQAPQPDFTAAVAATLPNWPQNDITVTVTLTNAGEAQAPKSVCLVYIRNAQAPRQTVKRIKKAVRALAPGDEFAFSFTIRLSPGMYEIEAAADRGNKIREKDEANNRARMTISGR